MNFDYFINICFQCFPKTISSVTNRKVGCPASTQVLQSESWAGIAVARYSLLKLRNNSHAMQSPSFASNPEYFLALTSTNILCPVVPTWITFIIIFSSFYSPAKYCLYPTKVQTLNMIPVHNLPKRERGNKYCFQWDQYKQSLTNGAVITPLVPTISLNKIFTAGSCLKSLIRIQTFPYELLQKHEGVFCRKCQSFKLKHIVL